MTLSNLIDILDDKKLTEEFNKIEPIARYDVKQVEDADNVKK